MLRLMCLTGRVRFLDPCCRFHQPISPTRGCSRRGGADLLRRDRTIKVATDPSQPWCILQILVQALLLLLLEAKMPIFILVKTQDPQPTG